MAHPFPLFEPIWSPSRQVVVTPEITSALEVGAAVAIGVSGGKDSAATALATIDYMEDVGQQSAFLGSFTPSSPTFRIATIKGAVSLHGGIGISNSCRLGDDCQERDGGHFLGPATGKACRTASRTSAGRASALRKVPSVAS